MLLFEKIAEQELNNWMSERFEDGAWSYEGDSNSTLLDVIQSIRVQGLPLITEWQEELLQYIYNSSY
jgi:hypothetical protein